MNALIQSKNTTILPVLIALTLGYFGLAPQTRADCESGCFRDRNTALGEDALSRNTDGVSNTGIGFNALNQNTTGFVNTATGSSALASNTTGSGNIATGSGALGNNTTGAVNTAVGAAALVRNTTGNNNIALGAGAGSGLNTGDNNIDIGNSGADHEANTIRIGTQGTQTATFIAGISGATVAGGVTVIVDANGQLGTIVSSERFKETVKPMDNASEAILALKPVTFHYKKDLDPAGIPQFGLVVEDVEKVNPDLVARDKHGKPYTVRYEAVNAMLLNEFLKEHRMVGELKKEITALAATVKEQAAQIQKVSAQVELSSRPPQTVVNNR